MALPQPFRHLTGEEFAKLSMEERQEYLRQAMADLLDKFQQAREQGGGKKPED
jgi:hypothetical protein